METLENLIDHSSRTAPGRLVKRLPDGRLQCLACAHRCPLPDGRRGVCKVRRRVGETLFVPHGYVAGVQVDPIEKKPFFHVLPGARALSFGMLGCDYRCRYCQNWITSQALRDPVSEEAGAAPQDVAPEELIALARRTGCALLTSTYNEPLITAEWSAEIFERAHEAGFLTSFVSNGNATREVLEFLRPHLDLYKVDLKAMNDQTYRRCFGGRLEPVLETLVNLLDLGFWVEVVTLVVPGLNDSEKELTAIARFLASLSPDIPWHVTAFHPDYQMNDREATSAEKLLQAYEIGRAAGLHFVYAGNLPGVLKDTEDTFCPSCNDRLIRRWGFSVRENKITQDGRCPTCGATIPGVFGKPSPRPRETAAFHPPAIKRPFVNIHPFLETQNPISS